jgi:putative dimethyl sulfoxide reductase chaperone
MSCYERLAALFDGETAGDSRDEATEAEYARLFVLGPNGRTAPPYASCYLDGQLLGLSREWVEHEYLAEGLALADDAEEPADYLPCELEYLFFLARHERAAETIGDDGALASARAAQRRFLDQHLLRWLPQFLRQARAANPDPFYAAALDSLESFVSEERARLSSD